MSDVNWKKAGCSRRAALAPVLQFCPNIQLPQSTTTGINLSEELLQCATDNLNAYRTNQILPSQDLHRKNGENKVCSNTPTTPRKRIPDREPLTPTTNLKLLTNLATGGKENGEENNPIPSSSKLRRKDKSLGILCDRFLSKYPDIPASNEETIISLDAVARDLQVERRRIYDIVNVLESVEFMVKKAKNRYTWQGRSKLHLTLAKLKAAAECENIAKQLEHFKSMENNATEVLQSPGSSCSSGSHCERIQCSRREKSLSVMSQTFLMIFMVSEPKIVSLDLAAKMLIGEMDAIEKKNIQYKTKIRRLYDIANILTSLKLVEKINMSGHSKKPAFRYTGPEVDDSVIVSPLLGVGLECSRGLLSGTKRAISKPLKPTSDCKRLKLPRATSENSVTQQKSKAGSSIVRHSSFQEICEVAEREREKLYANEQDKKSNAQGKAVAAPTTELKLLANSGVSSFVQCADGSAMIAIGGQTFRIVAILPLGVSNPATVPVVVHPPQEQNAIVARNCIVSNTISNSTTSETVCGSLKNSAGALCSTVTPMKVFSNGTDTQYVFSTPLISSTEANSQTLATVIPHTVPIVRPQESRVTIDRPSTIMFIPAGNSELPKPSSQRSYLVPRRLNMPQ